MEKIDRALVIGCLGALLAVGCFERSSSVDESREPHDTCSASSCAPVMGDASLGGATSDPLSSGATGGEVPDVGREQRATSSAEDMAAPDAAVRGAATTEAAAAGATDPTPNPTSPSQPTGSDEASKILPEDCVMTDLFAASEGILSFTCEDQPYTVDCYRLAEAWRCACRTEYANYTSETKSYEIATESAERAASLAALTCLGDDPEFVAAPEACTTEEQADSSACTLTEACRRSTEVEGVQVVFVDTGSSYTCIRDSSDLAACRCGDSGWKFPDVKLEEGCGFLRTFCASATRTPTGQRECTPGNQEATGDSCYVYEECAYGMQLSDGSVATVALIDGVSCNTSMTERPFCSCNDHEGRLLQFEHSASPLTIDECWVAAEVCRNMPQFERTGSYQCELFNRTTAGTSCGSTLNCRQPATVGETSIELVGTLTTQCEGTADSDWQCSCTSTSVDGVASNEADVTLSAEDLASACELAETRCMEEVEVVFASGLPGN